MGDKGPNHRGEGGNFDKHTLLGGRHTHGVAAGKPQSASNWFQSKKEGSTAPNEKQHWLAWTKIPHKNSVAASSSHGFGVHGAAHSGPSQGKHPSKSSSGMHPTASAANGVRSGRSHAHGTPAARQSSGGHAPSGRLLTPSSPFSAPQHQHQEHGPHSPLNLGPTVRPLRTPADASSLQGPGLPPPSPSKPSAPRFARPPSTSLDPAQSPSAAHAAQHVASHASLRASGKAPSAPGSPALSAPRPTPPFHFGSPRTSATGSAVASVFALSSAAHTSKPTPRPSTALGSAGSGAWEVDVADAPGSKHGIGGGLAASAAAQPAPTEAAAHASSSSSVGGGLARVRVAWEPSSGGTRNGQAGSSGGSPDPLPRPSGGALGVPLASSPRTSGLAGVRAGVAPSVAASPSRLSSLSGSLPLPVGFEGSGLGSAGGLSGLNTSRYTSTFGLAFAAESLGEMEGLLHISPLSAPTVTAAHSGSCSKPSSASQLHTRMSQVGEEPISPHAAGSGRRDSFTGPPALLSRMSMDSKPTSALAHSLAPGPSSAAALAHRMSGTPPFVLSPSSGSAAAALAASGLLSGSALAAHRALKGPSPPPSGTLSAFSCAGAGAATAAAAAAMGDAGEGEGGAGMGGRAAHARNSSWGQDLLRGRSLLYRSSNCTDAPGPGPATAPVQTAAHATAATPAATAPAAATIPPGSAPRFTGSFAWASERRKSSADVQPVQPVDAPGSLPGGGPRGMPGRAPSAPLAQAAACDAHRAQLGSAAISSTSLSVLQQKQQEQQGQGQECQAQQEGEAPKEQVPQAGAGPQPPPVPNPPSAATAAVAPPASSDPGVSAPPKAFVGVGAVQPAPNALPPRGIPPADYAAMLGCEVSTQHTAALPGYTVGKVIGEGGFCQVRLAVHHLSGRKVAVKVIDKAKLTDANEAKRIQREIRVMLHLTHECVIKLFEVVDAADMLYLVMEHAPNPSLLDYVRSRKRLSEGKAAIILKQIVAGLQYCHSREVVHRDIKLENILMGADGNMKIIDFGLSAFFIPGKRLRVHCGSPSYAAPEIVARKQYEGPLVDVWSLGVVLFACLAGHLPFHSSSGNKQELCQKIVEGKFNMPSFLSPAAKDLLTLMLQVDPERRVTFEGVQAHPWVQAVSAWAPQGGSVYGNAVAGAPDEDIVAELELWGYTRHDVWQALQSRTPNYLTTSFFLLAEAKAERARAEKQVAPAPQLIKQQQQQQQQEAAAAPRVASERGMAAAPKGASDRPLPTAAIPSIVMPAAPLKPMTWEHAAPGAGKDGGVLTVRAGW